jgi:hypothetical protein
MAVAVFSLEMSANNRAAAFVLRPRQPHRATAS